MKRKGRYSHLDKYNDWIEHAHEFQLELRSMSNIQIEESFCADLSFGTGGLRGLLGVGTNRMNIYTVAKASQGLSDYIKKKGGKSIAISYDSRTNSELFSIIASEVFVANGLKVYIFSELMPTPCLSFAVRYYDCHAGVMITASHNPAKYNGYKVYNQDGCQITDQAAHDIQEEINKLDVFDDVLRTDYNQAVAQGYIEIIGEDCYSSFINSVKNESVLYGDEINRDVSIIYSPLNGTGLKPVMRVLEESGFTKITVVDEQKLPNGNFPTCPYPNPEVKEAMQLGIEYAVKKNADIVIATDPDCDRIGIAVRDNNEYRLLTGNETGLLLLNYICEQRTKHNRLPHNPIVIKTIVTTNLAEKIAAKYDITVKNVLTGFKYIGEQIGYLEKEGKTDSYIFGFEESYGYLSGSYVRDKDAVDGVLMICEMFAYYNTQNVSLIEKLQSIYNEFGFELNALYSYQFEGINGLKRMQDIMCNLRNEKIHLGSYMINKTEDFLDGLNGLPASNVIKYWLGNGITATVRPSGTEPKMKVYLSVAADGKAQATEMANDLMQTLEREYIQKASI